MCAQLRFARPDFLRSSLMRSASPRILITLATAQCIWHPEEWSRSVGQRPPKQPKSTTQQRTRRQNPTQTCSSASRCAESGPRTGRQQNLWAGRCAPTQEKPSGRNCFSSALSIRRAEPPRNQKRAPDTQPARRPATPLSGASGRPGHHRVCSGPRAAQHVNNARASNVSSRSAC